MVRNLLFGIFFALILLGCGEAENQRLTYLSKYRSPSHGKRFEPVQLVKERPYSLGIGSDLLNQREWRSKKSATITLERLSRWQTSSGLWVYSEVSGYLEKEYGLPQSEGFVDDRTNTTLISLLIRVEQMFGLTDALDMAEKAAHGFLDTFRKVEIGDGFLFWSYVNLDRTHPWKKSVVSFNHNLRTLNAFLDLWRVTGKQEYWDVAQSMVRGIENFNKAPPLLPSSEWRYGWVSTRNPFQSLNGLHLFSLMIKETQDQSPYQDLEVAELENVQNRLFWLNGKRSDVIDSWIGGHLRWAENKASCQRLRCGVYALSSEDFFDRRDFVVSSRGVNYPFSEVVSGEGRPKRIDFGSVSILEGEKSFSFGKEIRHLDQRRRYSVAVGPGNGVAISEGRILGSYPGKGGWILKMGSSDKSRLLWIYWRNKVREYSVEPSKNGERIEVQKLF